MQWMQSFFLFVSPTRNHVSTCSGRRFTLRGEGGRGRGGGWRREREGRRGGGGRGGGRKGEETLLNNHRLWNSFRKQHTITYYYYNSLSL